jgi:gliding motility-associated-like protein
LRVILTFILTFTCFLSHGQNFTNKGREFWVGYGHNQLFGAGFGNTQDMVVYLSAEQPANVTVSIPGTTWVRTYSIPANAVVVTDLIPKSGGDDCRITNEGLYRKNIHIESNVPIVAYAHIYGSASSGAAMLLPVETYGYTYMSLNTTQDYDKDCYSWFYVVAAENSTRVRITPAALTKGGRAQDTPFDIDLNKGEVYNVMGNNPGTNMGNDLSGSVIQSIPGSDGKCHPISVFSGSSRTNVCTAPLFGGGDFMMQQVFPATAWGARYLTGLTSSSTAAATLNPNRFRVYVRDPSTKVYANGVRLTGLVNYAYFDFLATTSQYITADQPIMVAQLMPSHDACGYTDLGDPEIIFLSPMEQAIKNVTFYNTNKESIQVNYLTLIVHRNGLPSLSIDGSPALDHSYDHPGLPDYKVVVKKLASVAAQHTVTCDSGFNAITYGLGLYESYGYNAGSYVNNLTFLAELKNDLSAGPNTYTCPKTPFGIVIKTLYPLTGIIWHYGEVPGFTPNANIVYTNPVLAGTEVVNGKTYNLYKQPLPASAPSIGTFYVPVTIQSPSIDNCSNSEKFIVEIKVLAGPTADFTAVPDCANKPSVFTGSSAEAAVDTWEWDFDDGAFGTGSRAERIYSAGGNYEVTMLAGRSVDGCAIPVTKTVTIPGTPVAVFDPPAVVCMPGGESKFLNRSTIPGTNNAVMQYKWTFGDGGTATDQHPIHYYASRGSYPVTLIATSTAGCADTTDAVISTFADRPVAGFTASATEGCAGTEFRFTDNSTIPGDPANAIWKWDYDDGTTGTTATPAKTYTKASSYTVFMHLTSSEGCISDTATTAVTVYPVPVVNAGPDVITEPNRPVQLKASVTPVTADVVWSPPTGLSDARQLQPVATLQENQGYVITATGAYGCSATDTVLVKVFKELKIPNAFSPNGDGRNDTWRIPGLDEYHHATVQVFNRWGQVVFRSVGYGIPWNGMMNGNKLPTGAYYYVIKPGDNGYGTLSGMVMIVH